MEDYMIASLSALKYLPGLEQLYTEIPIGWLLNGLKPGAAFQVPHSASAVSY